jgi:YHS domain-containing protein
MPFSRKIRFTRPDHKPEVDKPCEVVPPDRNGLVLRGYDVVEYHKLEKRDKGVMGSSKYKYLYQNDPNGHNGGGGRYTFYFKNKENLAQFSSDVERYLPQFGGFCSWGFANEWGGVVDGQVVGDPEVPDQCKECLTSPPWAWTQHIMGPPADPENGWSIYGGKLYFNINSNYRELWEAQPERFIKRAKDRWTKYYGDAVGPINVTSYPWNWQQSAKLTPSQQRCLRLSQR